MRVFAILIATLLLACICDTSGTRLKRKHADRRATRQTGVRYSSSNYRPVAAPYQYQSGAGGVVPTVVGGGGGVALKAVRPAGVGAYKFGGMASGRPAYSGNFAINSGIKKPAAVPYGNKPLQRNGAKPLMG